MLKLLGIVLWILGDLFCIRYFNEKEKQKSEALEEMLLFLRTVHCDVNEWKLPLEEAFFRQKDNGKYRNLLWEEFCKNKEQLGIRKALLSAVEESLSFHEDAKKLLTEYLSQLGKLKKEPAEELYQRVRSLLEDHLKQEKERFQARKKLMTGCVGGVSTMAVILLL